jgi:hypothetical protein
MCYSGSTVAALTFYAIPTGAAYTTATASTTITAET